MIPTKFKKELNKLNAEQKVAVDAVEGPVMVVAGPGTGKTQILNLRIANILAQTDAQPENILALTFTEAAAANRRRRLVGLIGSAGYYVEISTFHGFCNRLISAYPENFERIVGSKNISPTSQISLIREIIETTRLKHLKPFGDKFYYAGEILSSIKKLKNEGLTPKELQKKPGVEKPPVYRTHDRKFSIRSDKTLHRRNELQLVFQKYQQELRRRKFYDFDDMILETVSALETNKDFLLDLQEKYQYILVDEHQDTNGAQNKVLELLAGYDASPNLFVVGDEKQAIFRFQGANLENFLYFKNKFPRAKIIELKNNYRSTQNILDASDHLIRHNAAVLSASVLKAATRPAGKKINLVATNTTDDEHSFIAGKIKEFIKRGHVPKEIAVIYRENKDAAPLAETLERHGIAFSVESDENILEDIDIKKLNALLAAIYHFPSTEHLTPVLHADFWQLKPLDIYKWIGNKDNAEEPVNEIVNKIGEWKKLSYNQTFPRFFETIIKDSGFLKNILSQADYADRIKRLNTLFNEIKRSARENHNYSLKDYLNYLEVLKEHNLPLQTKIQTRPDAVRLMTAHRAKGLEFETVFITGAYNGHWGNKRKPDYFGLAELITSTGDLDKNEDERRLFYMALTRAKKNVFVSYAQISAEGREQAPSQFINEIRPDLKEEIAVPTPQKQDLTLGLKSDFNPRPKVDEKAFIKDLFLKRGLSPTSLNNYLACSWKFFYVNLLRLPQTETKHQIYGTAKHYALQKFFEAERPHHKILTAKFSENLKRHSLTPADYQTMHQKGKESLIAYHNFYKNQWSYNTVNEFKISGVDFMVGKEKIRLTGKLDKLELHDSGFKNNVVVVDYKTKAPESRNWILGQTKNSTGDYFRQLVFYKLLLGNLPRQKYRMSAGVIDFTESDDKGKFRKETFEISNSDLSDLKDLIKTSADEILNLKFWNKGCNDKECGYCGLRSFLPKSH